MAIESARSAGLPSERGWGRVLLGIAVVLVLALVVVVIAALALSGVTLASDSTALARVTTGPLGGTIEHVEAFGPHGRPVPLRVERGRLTPLHRLKPGEPVSVDVEVRRPGWLGWALGATRTERLTLNAPIATVAEPWMTVGGGAAVQVGFDQPVTTVAYGDTGSLTTHRLNGPESSVSLGHQPATGAVEIAAAPRTWETLGRPMQVSWFPPSSSPVMVTFPAAGSRIAPATSLHLTFSKPVSEVLGSNGPRLSPATQGHWREVNSHTLVFTPSGFGAGLGSQLHIQLPHPVATTSSTGGLRTTNEVEWTVPPGSTLRMQQLLAEGGYLPVTWRATGSDAHRTPSAEAQAAVDPPAGSFSWRYSNTPRALEGLWSPGQENVVMKGAIMKFENTHNLTADGLPGPAVWRALMGETIAGKHLNEGYSYVYVHREVPETMTLWHAGHTIITSPANTGISGAETEVGTFPVFEHIPEGTMSGTNPDGSHYEDPGIKWISYFNGGDALHNFDRSSFGTPQSLGCVELPLAASAEIWPFTPIGTLVTIAS